MLQRLLNQKDLTAEQFRIGHTKVGAPELLQLAPLLGLFQGWCRRSHGGPAR
jgi:hypothetical protein